MNQGERFSVQQPYSSVLMPMKTGDAHEVLGVLTDDPGCWQRVKTLTAAQATTKAHHVSA